MSAKPKELDLRLTKDDFVSGSEVRWCPGCGDYAILSVLQRTLPSLSIRRENHVFISGIGCSSRLPYYVNAYGFHTIHGRAPAVATGLKCARPDLHVWVVTGDGDGLSIGGNHLIHCMRRNVDITILLINNRIYGLTKGQYSPTSPFGKITHSTPMGSIDYPINPLCIAIAAEATFVARTLDTDIKHLGYILERAAAHKGTSFIEIYQNCIVFNHGAFSDVAGRENREDRMVYLEHGQPLIFGKAKDRAIRLNGTRPEVVELSKVNQAELLLHDEKAAEPTLAYLLTQMEYPEMPVPFGVFRETERPSYETLMDQQIEQAIRKQGKGELEKLIYSGSTWTVQEEETLAVSEEERRIFELVPVEDSVAPLKPREKFRKMIMTETVWNTIDQNVKPVILQSTDSVQKAVEAFKEFKQSCLLIVEGEKLVGIVTYRDILRKVAGLYKDLGKVHISKIMTERPNALKKDDTVAYALNQMSVGGFRHLPIVSEDGKPIGWISVKAIVRHLSAKGLAASSS